MGHLAIDAVAIRPCTDRVYPAGDRYPFELAAGRLIPQSALNPALGTLHCTRLGQIVKAQRKQHNAYYEVRRMATRHHPKPSQHNNNQPEVRPVGPFAP